MADEKTLARMTDMVFRARLAAFEELAAAERKLLDYLDRLEDLGKAPDGATALSMQLSGFEPGWQRWKAMKRAETNLKLARIRARKAQAAGALHHAYARNSVAAGLHEKARTARGRDRALKDMELLQEQALIAALAQRG